MKIVLIGPSGAGKGCLAGFIVRDWGLPHISTGQTFRAHATKQTELGKEISGYINEGLFVPDDITVKMLFDRIGEPDCKNGFILDGFPRTLNQAKLLGEKVQIDRVIEIDASEETVMARLGGRYMCRKCETIHNKRYDDMSQCKSCKHSELYQRDDDKTEKIRKRLDQYRSEIDGMLSYYRAQGNLITVHSELEDKPEDLYEKFLQAVGRDYMLLELGSGELVNSLPKS